jgi:uncharacterized membrane protein YsdA (DUF1294 family)
MGNIGHKTQKVTHGKRWTQDTACLSFCVLCPMLPMSIVLCLVSNGTRVYLSVSCVQCFLCLSFCVLCPMLPMSIFLCLVSIVTRVYLSVSGVQCFGHKTQKDRHGYHWTQDTERKTWVTLDTRHKTIDTDNSGHKTQKDKHRSVYLSLSSSQCYPCLFFSVLCPMLPLSIFLCLVPNIPGVYLYVSCVQCYPCLSFCVL